MFSEPQKTKEQYSYQKKIENCNKDLAYILQGYVDLNLCHLKEAGAERADPAEVTTDG